MPQNSQEDWSLVIIPKNNLLELNLKELIQYRDLLLMFVRRDIVVVYKQTILGPIWFFVQPFMTMLIYIFVFGNIAKIPTEGIAPSLFYLSGIVMWNYFADCFNQTSNTFVQNAHIFGKVYFPRLIVPLSKIISALIKFFIQFLLFLAVYCYFSVKNNEINIQYTILFFPLLLILMAMLGLGMGLIFTALTTKYRDLQFLLQFGVQLLMYATPVIYSMNIIPENYKIWIYLNPLSHIIEIFRHGFIGISAFSIQGLIYCSLVSFSILILGILIFNKNEKSFMDTV
jgi:lipopolysaccharide transport system permease protein